MTRAPSTEEPCAANVACTVLKASEGGDPFAEPNQALKLLIRQRRNSLFYASTHSAYVASLLTSVIATCARAGINALAFWWRCRSIARRSSATPPPGYPGTIPNSWHRVRRPGASLQPYGRPGDGRSRAEGAARGRTSARPWSGCGATTGTGPETGVWYIANSLGRRTVGV
jgi:hypothetical protein